MKRPVNCYKCKVLIEDSAHDAKIIGFNHGPITRPGNRWYCDECYTAIEEFSFKNSWIKCSDRLPEEWGRVLAYGTVVTGKEVNLCFYAGAGDFYTLDERMYMTNVTYWCELPFPPKE